MVDDTGRMHGADYTTSQQLRAKNYGNQEAVILRESNTLLDTEAKYNLMLEQIRYKSLSDEEKNKINTEYAAQQNAFGESYVDYSDYLIQTYQDGIRDEDMWIKMEIDDSYEEPKIFITHNFTKVQDTTSTSDNNISASDEINLYTPIVDNKGHVVGHNTETVTLPYGFKKVTLMNSSLNTHSPSDLGAVIEDKVIANNTQDTLIFKAGNEWIKFDATSGAVNDIIHVYHQTEDTREFVTKNTDLNNGSATIGPILQTFTRDRGGHVNDLVPVSYTLPNGYSKFKSGETELSNAQNTMDIFVFKGDDWLKPTVSQGELIYTHINNHATLTEGIQNLGVQTPAFGATFNLQTYSLDKNGHVINKGVETVTLPTDISPLMIPESFDDSQMKFVHVNLTLLQALYGLDFGIQLVLSNLKNTAEELSNGIEALGEELNQHVTNAENTYALIEGNINSETEFEYAPAVEEVTETLEDGTIQVVTPAQEATNVTVAELVNIVKNIDDSAIRSETTFIYTPEVEEVSHEATQEDVDAGLATAIGDKVIDVEYVPAEELTIQELFNKVKALEQLLNS